MWVVKLERVVDGKVVSVQEVATVDSPRHLEQMGDFGLKLEQGKSVVAAIQSAVISEQVIGDAQAQRTCDACPPWWWISLRQGLPTAHDRHCVWAGTGEPPAFALSTMPGDEYSTARAFDPRVR